MSDDTLPLDFTAAQNISAMPGSSADPAVDEVAEWLDERSAAALIGVSIRQAIDEVLDGQRTGRYDIDDLEKTEKTYLGTKVEIIIRSAFGLQRGQRMDYLIADHEVDSKFTIGSNWTIPKEAAGHICLLTRADDHRSLFSAGLLRIDGGILNAGENRDGKRSLSAAGRSAVRWIVRDGRLPENVLMSLTEEDRAAIFSAPGNQASGQLRTNELFRRVQRKVINRNTVVTVAKQDDSPKRVRDARKFLGPEGISFLGTSSLIRVSPRTLGWKPRTRERGSPRRSLKWRPPANG
ncbi:NaeI family type II restriction endonuclease [Streptomyces sp. NPDC094032]|uniref:NaeI family type II restriction endonuclease n=1 Tax=Streptomyces sp. NPDC094032 TaxID=3155308 RepID=UPI003327CDC7